MKNLTIRNEKKEDYREVENLIRESFGMFTDQAVMSTMLFISFVMMRLLFPNLIL